MTNQITATPGGAFRHIPDTLVHNAISRRHRADLQALKELLESETPVSV